MKVMLSTDIEGVSGVVDFEQIYPGNPLYEEARHYLTQDVNAAVEGCFEGGATEVIVADTHAMRMNVIFEDLHPDAQLIVGGNTAHRPQLVMESMDRSFDLALLIGFHAAAHYEGGILSHSYHMPTNFFEVRINDMLVGEPEIATALAGAFGVPCGLITGDDVTVNEYLALRPGTEGVIVKWALDRTAARCLSLQRAGELIRAGAKRAVERASAGEFSPWTFEPPMLLAITCSSYGLANKLAGVPGAERLDRRVVGFRSESYPELYQALMTFAYLSAASK